MDRKSLREQTHNPKELLTLENPEYKASVLRYTFGELNADLGGPNGAGDITTKSMFPEKKPAKGVIFAKEDGVIAGLEELEYFLVKADPTFRPQLSGNFSLKSFVKDGDQVKIGDPIVEISADISDLLAVERTVLNLLTRMSGIATNTKRIVDSVAQYDVLVTATRKTLWGLLDKKAVTLGSGGSHRLNLADAILIKDTHLDPLGRNFDEALSRVAKSDVKSRFIEIEVLSKEEAIEACRAFIRSKIQSTCVIMFDNMSPEEISAALDELKTQNLYDNFLFEASGGITEKNITSHAQTGVDVVSIGALTASAHALDLSLKIDQKKL